MIRAKQLVKHYGSIRAVQGVSFQVDHGDVLGFLGPNGAGKSTSMKMITGFLPPTSGTAEIGGKDIQTDPLAAKKLLGYLPESGPLYPEMTVTEFLQFIAEIRELEGKAATKALDRVTEICHLEGVLNQPIETLSKGYRQRVGMAQAVLHDPPYLVMDEPTDGLDPNQKQEVRKLIASMGEEKAIVLSTHILEEVEAMCNRIIIVAQGRILVDEKPEDLRKRHQDYGCLQLTLEDGKGDEVEAKAKKVEGVAETEARNGHLLLRPRKGAEIRSKVWEASRQQSWPVTAIEQAPTRLEDVFRSLTLDSKATASSKKKNPSSS